MSTTAVEGVLHDADAFLADLARRQQERWLADCQLEDELAVLSAQLSAGTARLVELVWEHRQQYGHGVARYIAFKAGVTTQEANELVRVAEALRELPLIRAAFGRGEITFVKVRALTRVATPSSEEGLLELAGALTASQLQRALRVYRRVTVEEAHNTHELESVNWWFDHDGSLMLKARLSAEDGTLVVKALDAAHDRVLQRRREERAAAGADHTDPDDVDVRYGPGDPVLGPPRSTRVEALVEVAQAALHGPDDPTAVRTRLVVHVDAATLTRDGQGRCELEDGPVISPETARRLGCDADLITQIELDGLPLSVGRTRRTVPPALRRLLEARDDTTCIFPGCERHRHLEAHHCEHWAHLGETELDNLVLLCFHHHRFVHEGGYTVEFDEEAGGFRFRNRSGLICSTRPPKPPPTSLDQLITDHQRLGIVIGPKTNRHGSGDLMNLAYIDNIIANIINGPPENVWTGPPWNPPDPPP